MRKKLQTNGTVGTEERVLKRFMLALIITGVAATFCGCLSVHVHKDEEQPSPVIIVPNDHPNP
jgi:hypothetical protein